MTEILNSTVRNSFPTVGGWSPNAYTFPQGLQALNALMSVPHTFPMLQGLWGAQTTWANNDLIDHSGNGEYLALSGSPRVNHQNADFPYIAFDGSGSDAFQDAALSGNFDIDGSNARVNTPIRGVTLGTWLRPLRDSTSGNEFFFSKWSTAVTNSRTYGLYQNNLQWRFGVYDTTLTLIQVANITSTSLVDTSLFFFVCGVWSQADSEIKIFVNGDWTRTTGPGGNLQSSPTIPLTIGARSDLAQEWNGLWVNSFICGAAVPESTIEMYYEMTAPLFGAPI